MLRLDVDHFLELSQRYQYDSNFPAIKLQGLNNCLAYAASFFSGLMEKPFFPFLSPKYKAEKIAKALGMQFLDKIEHLLGPSHPLVEILDESCSGWNGVESSLAVIKSLTEIKDHPSLQKKAKILIRKWIATEIGTFPLTLLMNSVDILSVHEINLISKAIVKHIKSLPSGARFKISIGSEVHDTRMFITKSANGNYCLEHFDTSCGSDQDKALSRRYYGVKRKILEQEKLWQTLFLARFSQKDWALDCFFDLLDCKSHKIEAWFLKSPQATGSCTIKAIEQDFKYFFISSFNDWRKGVETYKLLRALMLHKAAQDISTLGPVFSTIFMQKEMIKHRFIDWHAIAKDQNSLLKVQAGYLKAINLRRQQLGRAIFPFDSFYGNPRMWKIIQLDKELNRMLQGASYPQLKKLRAGCGLDLTFNGVDYLGLKQVLHIENVRLLMHKSITSYQLPSLKQWVDSYKSKEHDWQKVETLPSLELENIELIWAEYIAIEDPKILKAIYAWRQTIK